MAVINSAHTGYQFIIQQFCNPSVSVLYMKRWNIILCLLGLLMAGCGHPDAFRVQRRLDDKATINLRVVFHTDRGVITGITAANAGEFAFEGSSAELAMVEVYDNEYRLQARFAAQNGNDIEVDVNRTNRFASRVKGNPVAEAFTDFLATNAEALKAATPEGRNAIIADYIKTNTDSPVSMLLLWGEFDAYNHEALGDSLTALLPPGIKNHAAAQRRFEELSQVPAPKADSITFRVSGGKHKVFTANEDTPALLVFSDSRTSDHRNQTDSIKRLIKLIKQRDVKVYELNCDPDTSSWRRAIYNDSATWTQGWLEGGPAAPDVARLRLPTLPYYIVVDTTGTMINRSTALSDALNTILKSF